MIVFIEPEARFKDLLSAVALPFEPGGLLQDKSTLAELNRYKSCRSITATRLLFYSFVRPGMERSHEACPRTR
jgi:hypothetical protein